MTIHIFPQVLNLDFCTLGNLPASLGDLTALTTLDVEGNLYLGEAFRQLPSTPPGMPPLFPLNLSGLSSLRYLNLNACGLTQIPEVSMWLSPDTPPDLAAIVGLALNYLCVTSCCIPDATPATLVECLLIAHNASRPACTLRL